uniref:Uncharacterized protein n=1 Tax=Erpetoichthys calabaricus TaxID=27687 RepID=A0A8C4T7T3_ERPCA
HNEFLFKSPICLTDSFCVFGLQDEFICLVCLEILSDPVSIPCGHSFCLKCLSDYWEKNQECSCPQCREIFTTRPELHINTELNEAIKKIKIARLSTHPSQNYAGPGDVECDFCTGKKSRAVKSCLTCAVSYCQAHLQPHFEVAAWKDHKLTDPIGNLKEKLCVKHHKSLEIFCKTDETCICMMCGVTEHENHEKVELKTEKEEKQASGVQCLMKESKDFTDLICCIEETCRKLVERTREQEKREIEKAEGVMEQLEEEIDPVTHSQISSLFFFSLLSDFCPLTLDINTAHRRLHLFEGNKKVTRDGSKANYPDHPDRFDRCPQVLCREALTGTRCYWEVECTGENLGIGVAYQGLSRKGDGIKCGLGNNGKSWSLYWSYSQYSVYHNNKCTVLSAPYCPRIGVYLDWPAGSLSFYTVSHTMTLLHRLNTPFTKSLYPGFGFGPDCSVTICHLTPGDN